MDEEKKIFEELRQMFIWHYEQLNPKALKFKINNTLYLDEFINSLDSFDLIILKHMINIIDLLHFHKTRNKSCYVKELLTEKGNILVDDIFDIDDYLPDIKENKEIFKYLINYKTFKLHKKNYYFEIKETQEDEPELNETLRLKL